MARKSSEKNVLMTLTAVDFPGSEKLYYNNTSFGPGHGLQNYLDSMAASREENKMTAIWITIYQPNFFNVLSLDELDASL